MRTWLTSQPFLVSVSVRKRPIWSLPTRASIDAARPSRAQPNAIFADDPPRYFAKLDTSSSRAPTCCAYRSTARRPRQTMSRLRADAERLPLAGAEADGVPLDVLE